MRPDLKSVGADLFLRYFLALNTRFLQRLTSPFQTLNGETRLENALPRKFLRPRMSKKVSTRDAKLAAGRELSKGNLLSALVEEQIRRLFRLNQDNRRSCLDPESGQAF